MKAERVRKAANFLRGKALKVSPSALARAAAELGLGLAATLAFIQRLKQGAQDQSSQRRELLRKISETGG